MEECLCPICLEEFRPGEQVILSCSHVFHEKCLSSFENFQRRQHDGNSASGGSGGGSNGGAAFERSCPVCRRAKYEKKRTTQVGEWVGGTCRVVFFVT